MPEVKAPDGTIVRFPEGMSTQEMQDAMRKRWPRMGMLESAKEGFMDPFIGIEQMHRHASDPANAASYDEYVRNREHRLQEQGIYGLPRFAGEMVSPTNLITMPFAGAEGVIAGMGPLARSAVGGAVGGGTMPVTGGEQERMLNTALGAAEGLGLGWAGERARAPMAPTVATIRKEGQRLADEVAKAGPRISREDYEKLQRSKQLLDAAQQAEDLQGQLPSRKRSAAAKAAATLGAHVAGKAMGVSPTILKAAMEIFRDDTAPKALRDQAEQILQATGIAGPQASWLQEHVGGLSPAAGATSARMTDALLPDNPFR